MPDCPVVGWGPPTCGITAGPLADAIDDLWRFVREVVSGYRPATARGPLPGEQPTGDAVLIAVLALVAALVAVCLAVHTRQRIAGRPSLVGAARWRGVAR